MKRLILINGTMGVGKSTVAHQLQRMLPACALLDGDWCWNVLPFSVSDESKRRVIDNIVTVLNGYLSCDMIENVIFCWVLPREEIVQRILARLLLSVARLFRFTLTASPECLRARLYKDIAAGLRQEDVVARSLAYLPLYEAGDESCLIATDHRAAEQIACDIAQQLLRED